MEWFNRWFYRCSKRAWENRSKYEQEDVMEDISNRKFPYGGTVVTNPRLSTAEDNWGADGVQFTLHAANGGVVLKTYRFDVKTDRPVHKLYVIPEGDDLGESISRIVTMENLSR